MTREKVKKIAIGMVDDCGLINLSRQDLCDKAGIPNGSFPNVMGCNFVDFVNELKAEGYGGGAHQLSKKRAAPGVRKESILAAAINVAKRSSYLKVTRDCIASEAGISTGLVTRYFGTMNQLRREIMRAAVKQRIPELVAQGLASGDERARKAPTDLKAQAAELLASS